MSLATNSRAYDPTYHPPKALEQLLQENPASQFLADQLAATHAALKEQAAGAANLSPSIAAAGGSASATSSLPG